MLHPWATAYAVLVSAGVLYPPGPGPTRMQPLRLSHLERVLSTCLWPPFACGVLLAFDPSHGWTVDERTLPAGSRAPVVECCSAGVRASRGWVAALARLALGGL